MNKHAMAGVILSLSLAGWQDFPPPHRGSREPKPRNPPTKAVLHKQAIKQQRKKQRKSR